MPSRCPGDYQRPPTTATHASTTADRSGYWDRADRDRRRNRGGPTSGHGRGRRRSRPLPADPIAGRRAPARVKAYRSHRTGRGQGRRTCAATRVGRSTRPKASRRTPPRIRRRRANGPNAHMIGDVVRSPRAACGPSAQVLAVALTARAVRGPRMRPVRWPDAERTGLASN